MTRPSLGALRHRLTVESRIGEADGGGGIAVAWTPVATVWGAVRSLSGSEAFLAESLRGVVTHEVIIRKRSDVVPAMRLRLGARILDIQAVLGRDEPEPYLRLLVEERNQ